MALIDKNGRLLAYFDSLQSGMYNSKNNNIRTAVLEVVDKDYQNPCDDGGKKDNDKKDKKDTNDGKKNKYEVVEDLDALKAKCSVDKDTCYDCRGKYSKKRGCRLARKLKCKHMNTME